MMYKSLGGRFIRSAIRILTCILMIAGVVFVGLFLYVMFNPIVVQVIYLE